MNNVHLGQRLVADDRPSALKLERIMNLNLKILKLIILVTKFFSV